MIVENTLKIILSKFENHFYHWTGLEIIFNKESASVKML